MRTRSFHHLAAIVLTALLLAASATPSTARQAGTITGVVSDQTGAAVANATVTIDIGSDTPRTTTTDAQGRFRSEGLPAGDHTVVVAAPGFQSAQRQMTITAGSSVAAEFTLGVRSLQESVVVAETLAKAEIEEERSLTPGGVTILESDELFRRPVNGMADMLRYVPGVWAESSSGSEELFFSSRGSNLDATDYDKNGIKLLQDGLPVTTADGNNHNRVIDPLSARYTVVARGANALTYGASTLGGAIDFISPTARNSAPVSASFNSGSHGSLNGRATVGGTREDFDGLLTVEGRQWEGYRDHSSQNRWGLNGNGGWRMSDTADLRVFATYVDNDQRLPGALTGSEVRANRDQASEAAIGGDYGKVVKTARVAAKTTWTLGTSGVLSAGLSYEGQSLFHPIVNPIFVDFDGPGPAPPVEVFSLLIDTDHRDLGAMVRYDGRAGAHDLVAGLTYGNGSVTGGNYRNLNGQPNGISELVDNTADSVEAFVADRWRASDRWTLVFGAQVVSAARDVRTTNAQSGAVSNPARRYTSFNPRAGVIRSLGTAVQVYGNVSRLFEAPTTFQMEDDVRGGNATLEPMTGTVAEVGLRSAPNPAAGIQWTWDVAAYYARIRDEILSLDDPDAPGNSLTANIDRTIHAGVEALASVSVSVADRHRIDPLVSLTVNRFRFLDDAVYGDNHLPAAPTYAARGEVIYRHAGGFFVGPTFDLVGRRYADFTNSYTVDRYGLMGVRAGLSRPRWELFGEVRNLFDEEYIATLSVLDVADADARVLYPGAPLSAYVGIRFAP